MPKKDKTKKLRLNKQSRLKPFPLARKVLANRLYRTIEPDVYGDIETVKRKATDFLQNVPRSTTQETYSEDAWAKYLGLQQPTGTITESQYRPSVAKNKRGKYYRLPDEVEQALLEGYQQNKSYIQSQSGDPRTMSMNENEMRAPFGRVLGNFTVGEGVDEETGKKYLSYYDKYDLAPETSKGAIKAEKVFGDPFEFYNRIYYKDGGAMPDKNKKSSEFVKGTQLPLTKKEYAKNIMDADYKAYLKGLKTGIVGNPKIGDDLPKDLTYNQYSNYIKALNPRSQTHPRLNQIISPQRSGRFNRLPYDDYVSNLPQESLGGILGSIAQGAGTGALSGSVVPGLGTGIGAVIGGATGLIKGLFGHRQEKLAQQAQDAETADRDKLLAEQTAQAAELAEQEKRDMQIQNKIGAMPQAPVYAPVVADGGLINYNGPSHANSPQGGIPVDGQGNPIQVTKQNPVALVEGGEIARYQPDGGVFIFSKKSGHAAKAAKLQKNFQKALGKDLNGVDKMAKEALNLRLDKLSEEQELAKLGYGGKFRKFEDGGNLPRYQDAGPLQPIQNIQASQFGAYSVSNPTGYQAPLTGRAGLGVTQAQADYNPYLGNVGVNAPEQSTPEGGGFNYGNLLSPVGHILSGFAAQRDYGRLKREGPTQVDLGPDIDPARMTAEQVSFAPERAIAREQASTSRASAARTARNLGLSGAQTAANVGATRTGIDRLAGQQIGQSIQKEAVTNVQMRQQANIANMQARQQGRLTDAQKRAQEGAYNAMLRGQYRDRLRQADPLSNWLRIGANYLGENVAYGTGQQTRELGAPNAQFAQPNPLQWLLGQKGKTTFSGPQITI